MGILKYFKKQSENQFQINSSINTVEKNNVIYTAYYKDMGDGYSSVECTITTPFNSQEHSFSIDAKIPNKLIKDDKPVILPINDGEKDFVFFAFPEEQKKLSVTSYTRYQVDLKSNSINAIPHGTKMSLSNNAKLSHSSNKYHSYSKSKAMELPNGDIIVAAVDSNSEGQYVTAWLLEKGQDLEFSVNEGSNKVTNRLLFKVDENMGSSFQLLPSNQNDNVGKIIYSDSTSLFSLDITKSMIDNIREGKYVNNEDEECLFAVGKERCGQFDKKISTPFLTSKGISNLSAVNTENGAVVAFLEDQQQLCIAKLTDKKGKKQIVHNYKVKIKLLQLSVVGENDIIVSAADEKNITQSTINSENLNVVTTRDFPTDGIRTLGDFVDIVYNNPLKLTTSFPYTTFLSSDASQISSSTVPVTTPLSTATTEEITTKESTTTIEGDTTSAATTEVTAQRITTKPKTTKHTTVTTTASTTQPTTTTFPQTTTSTERATTTAKTTAETSTAQHTTAGQSTTVTTISTTQPPKITTPAEETTISTNPTTSQTAKVISHTISSSSDAPKISSSTVSTTTPLATEEITTRGSTTTVEKDTTNAATTDVTTASTTQPTTTEGATTTAKTTVKTSTVQHTTADQSTTVTIIPTVQSSKFTTSTEKITVKPTTNQVNETTASTTKPTTKPTKATAKSTVKSTNNYTTSSKQGSTTVISTNFPQSTTTEMQSTAALGFTTLASTIGSAMVTILGSVTQNATNMLTTGNPMITGSSSDSNQTDVSSNYEEKLLSTAQVSTIVFGSIAVIGGMSYLIYRNCCRSNMRLPSEYTDDVGLWQRLRRYFRSCFNGQEQTIHALQLEPLDGDNANRVDSNEDEIVVYQKGISSSSDNLLPDQDQNSNDGVSNSASTVEKGKTSVNSELGSTEVSNGAGQNCNAKDRESAV
ncbi:hypothetical protein [Candidatus Mesenet endosymbiont of Phosphuga atrata]|uniref:hypothetical protein n=1 Tax=Candidatus Mesenet endosymbiont of Phosphuga atrata TaxID=3066221 RepID=UPI0030CABF85